MAVVSPAGFFQNAGDVHTAEVLRNTVNMMSVGKAAASSMKARGGVHRDLGGGLVVEQNGTPNMTVNVLSGMCLIPGTEGSLQGLYSLVNDATVNLAIGAAHATLSRIDLIVARIQDQAYSGGVNTPSLAVVAGTPSGSPTVPAAPANSLILAQLSVPATDTTITNSQITDKRPILTAPGGIIYCSVQADIDTAQISTGQVICETSFSPDRFQMWDGTQWTWPLARGVVGGKWYKQSLATFIGTNAGPSEFLPGMDTGSLTLERNRRLLIRANVRVLTASGAGTNIHVRVRETNISGAIRAGHRSDFGLNSLEVNKEAENFYVVGSTDETKTFVVSLASSAGTVNAYHGSTEEFVAVWVEDVGPALPNSITIV